MHINDFDYYLPEELIAQQPVEKRDASRLLIVHRDTGKLEHKYFYDIIDYLKPSDCLVLNNSKVIPARLFGVKKEKFSTAAAGVKTLGLTAGKNSLSGRYTASGGECVFLSVAYDEGLSAKINGKKAPLYEVYDGFTAFYLEEGENEVVISFRPKGLMAGTALCVVGLGLCVGACVYAKRKGGLVLPQGFDTVAYYAFIAVGGLVIAAVYVAPILLCIL